MMTRIIPHKIIWVNSEDFLAKLMQMFRFVCQNSPAVNHNPTFVVFLEQIGSVSSNTQPSMYNVQNLNQPNKKKRRRTAIEGDEMNEMNDEMIDEEDTYSYRPSQNQI